LQDFDPAVGRAATAQQRSTLIVDASGFVESSMPLTRQFRRFMTSMSRIRPYLVALMMVSAIALIADVSISAEKGGSEPQVQGAAPPPHAAAAHWVSYSGGAAINLAIILLVVACGFAYAGKRLRVPFKVMRPGGTAAGFMIAIWLLAIYTAGIAAIVYGLQVKEAYPGFVAARVRVGTFVDAPVTFFVILYLTRRWGWKVALASAAIGTAAAPMIFELPFDLIVLDRTNPPIPTHPMLYRQLFFLPLFLVELSTISLLTLLPSVRVTAYACYAVAGMFVVFAVWAAFGFAFPAEPLPLALNVISKILCFAAAIMLFVWRTGEGVPGGKA
jgi:hypothetical protein